jgi:hypothetical protein
MERSVVQRLPCGNPENGIALMRRAPMFGGFLRAPFVRQQLFTKTLIFVANLSLVTARQDWRNP